MKTFIRTLTVLASLLLFTTTAAHAGTPIDLTYADVVFQADHATWDMANGLLGCSVIGFSPLYDGMFGSATDAWDGGFIISLDGTSWGFSDPDGIGSLSDGNFTMGPATTGGLVVSRIERVIKGSPTLRDIIVLENPTGAAITDTLWIDTDLGAGDPAIQATSSGDKTFTRADRWVVNTDAPNAPFTGPPATQVFSGIGAKVHINKVLADLVGGVGSPGCLGVQMSVTVPKNSTRYVILFAQLHTAKRIGPAKADVKMFNARALSPTLLAGFPRAKYRYVLNWDL